MKKSEFNGSAWGLFGWNILLMIAVMFFIIPVVFVIPKYYKWYYSHVIIDGKQLYFDYDEPWWGFLGWLIFGYITLGLGAIYASKKMIQFEISHVKMIDESGAISEFNGSAWGLLGWGLLTVISVYLLIFPVCFVIVKMNKWFTSHTIISGKQLTFDFDGAWWGFLGWMLFIFVTFGLGAYYAQKKELQWIFSNTHFVE